jgi:hypothetical protein
LKDRRFVSLSLRVNDWTVEMKADDGGASSVSWILLYRATVSGYRVADFHQACDGMGKFVVVVKAENGRIAAAYNENGISSIEWSHSPNHNGFIVAVDDDGSCGEIFHRNDYEVGVMNGSRRGPTFGKFGLPDLYISNTFHKNEYSHSRLGASYGRGPGVNRYALFGQEYFRVVEYEGFKIVIE